MIRKTPLIAAAALSLMGAAAVLAQSVDGLDLGAIQNQADGSSADAQAFVNDIKRRSDALADDARQTAADGAENHQHYVATQGKADGASALDRMMADVTG